MRAAAAACLLAACTGSPAERGPVSVHAVADPHGDATVVFQDPDGSAREVALDPDGNADGELAAGGSVIYVTSDYGRSLAMYTDVQPGDALEFGARWTPAPPSSAPTVKLTLDAELPAGLDELVVTSPCGTAALSPGDP